MCRGESVREGEARGGKWKKRPGFFAGALLKKGALLPCTFRLLNWLGESEFTIYLGTAGTIQAGIENLIFRR